MFSHCLKFHELIDDTTASMHQHHVLAKKIFWASGVSHAVNSL